MAIRDRRPSNLTEQQQELQFRAGLIDDWRTDKPSETDVQRDLADLTTQINRMHGRPDYDAFDVETNDPLEANRQHREAFDQVEPHIRGMSYSRREGIKERIAADAERAEGLYRDFQDLYPDLASDPEATRAAAIEVMADVKARGFIGRDAIANYREGFLRSTADYQRTLQEPGSATRTAHEPAERTGGLAGLFGGTSRASEPPRDDTMPNQIRDLQRKHGLG